MAGADDRPTGARPDGAQADPVGEPRRRRLRAEAAAEAAEAAAAEAAARASAAIAAASRAAAAAEAAADAAARAAEEVEEAAAAERAALRSAGDATANETTAVAAMPPPVYRPMPGPVQRLGPPPAPNRPIPNGPAERLPAVDDAVTVALPMTMPEPSDAVTPATGGRASRRRAQEAAAEVAQEAKRDPETVAEPHPRSEGGPVARVIRSARAQLDLRAVLTASAVGTVLLVAGVLAAVVGGPPGAPSEPAVPPSAAAPSTVPPAATSAPTSAEGPTGAVAPPAAPTGAVSDAPADPTSPKAVAYLAALRAAGVPTSGSGESETQAAAVICQQLAKGTDPAQLVQALPAVLPSVNSRQARSMVDLARSDYC